MKLYSVAGSPNALRSRAVIYELDAPVEIVNLDFRKGENKTPEYLKLNPNGKVPTFVDGDVVIWESRAINAYLAAKFPQKNLYPADLAKRAEIDRWSYWQAIHIGPSLQKVSFERVLKKQFNMGEPDEAAVSAELKTADPLLDIFDRALAESGGNWICGELSIADFAFAPNFRLRRQAALPLETRPHIEAWMDRMEQRPSWQKAVAEIAG